MNQPQVLTSEITMQMTVHNELPPLSWLARVYDNKVEGHCGANVELFNYGLVEGCWDGPFEEYGFKGAENLFGTGMVIENNAVIFVAPTHTLEALYLLHGHGSLIASNSLAFLLEFTNLNLPVSKNYGRRFATMALGIDKYEKTICDIEGKKLLRIACTNVSWCNGYLSYPGKRPPPRFGSSTSELVRRPSTNSFASFNCPGRAPRFRELPFRPTENTCSSGMDATTDTSRRSSSTRITNQRRKNPIRPVGANKTKTSHWRVFR